jgi:type IV secretion system protein VirB10
MPPYDDDDALPAEEEGREEEGFSGDCTEPFSEDDPSHSEEGEGEHTSEDDFPPSQWDIRHEDNSGSGYEDPEEEGEYTDPFGASGQDEGDDPLQDGGREPDEGETGTAGREGSEERVLSTEDDQDPGRGSFAPPQKSQADHILGGGPRKLNKQLILYIITGVFLVFIIFTTFIVPLFTGSKSQSAAKPKAEPAGTPDYYSLVPRKPEDSAADQEHTDGEEDWRTVTFDDLPPVIDPRYRYQEEQTEEPVRAPAGSGSGGLPARPDTRNDRLWGKSIAGIKGLTPSQRNYLDGWDQIPYSPYTETQNPELSNPNNPYARFGMPPKDDYTRQMLAMADSQNLAPGSQSGYTQQNDQSGKMLFYNNNRENSGTGQWLPLNSLWQGSIFEATLTSTINTDLPGECTAWIAKNVYSSLDGRFLLIPQNSRLFGTYNSSISYSQSRVQVGWHTLIRPDGYMINLGNMQATDPQGAAGLKGFINDHPFQYLKALGLLTAFNIINVEFGATIGETQNQYVQNVMANSQEIANTLGAKLIDRALDVQPTITIKSGTKINVVVNTNLTLPPLEPYPVKYPYRKER